ncbi:barstar family protein [Gordonia sp. CPCC 206044]|uniref:barstar family protein n=1 Tax=Gordonia sp. CPCC 206044 TaxID=3140793 RepID=UPI003AF332B1
MSRPVTPIPLAQFLSAARRHGPVAGIVADEQAPDLPARVRVRTVDAVEMPTVADLFDEFARAWDFPAHFGHNKDAFDDCMRDLGGAADDDTVGFVTVIANAPRLLREEPDELGWFAESLTFYRDHYRDIATAPTGFAALLLTPVPLTHLIEERWRDAGSPVAEIEYPEDVA